VLGGLRGPAAGNEDGVVLPIGAFGPEQVIVRAAFLPVLPEASIFLEAVDRGWIGVTFVKRAHVLSNARDIRAS